MLKWLSLCFGALLVIAAALVWWVLSRSLPQTPAELFAPVQDSVSIHYDQRRRPFVRATSWQDAFFAQGWLHANERLWQMELLRRAAQGRLAEVLGAGMLATDIELTKVGVPELGRRIQSHTSDQTRSYVDAYVAGVNTFLSQSTALPPEFSVVGFAPSAWRAEDVFAMGGLMAWQSGNNLSKELLRLALLQYVDAYLQRTKPNLSDNEHRAWQRVFFPMDEELPDFPLVVTASEVAPLLKQVALSDAGQQAMLAAPALGSNGWVVAPSRSETGNVLFAFDSHDGFSMPNLTYDIHLFVGEQQIRGTSVPGLLGVINGFNEFMAWGFTNIGDSQDLFVEELDALDSHRIKGREGWYQAEVEEVLIPVAGQSPHRLNIVHTENGRLWSESPPLSLRWSALDAPSPNLDALLGLNRATSYEVFERVMDEFAAPSANATYADITGRIAFRTTGVLPLRGQGEGLIPLRGSAKNSGWTGVIPPSQMPRLVDPQHGFIAAANARVNQAAPLISADNAPGYRISRLHSVLSSNASMTFRSMQDLQTDWFNGQAKRVLTAMLAAVQRDLLNVELQARLDQLEQWKAAPVNSGAAQEPLWFAAWYREIGIALFEPVVGAQLLEELLGEAYVFNHAVDRLLILEADSPWWQGQQGAMLAQVLIAASERFDLNQTWQETHGVLLRHELSSAVPLMGKLLDSGPHPWGGGNATVGRARYSYKQPFTATGGATVRLVIEMSSPMQAATISPGGQSGHFLSSHYDDQTAAWLQGALDPLPANPEALELSTRMLPIPAN